MNIKIIGDIFLEHYVQSNDDVLGGIMHSARMLSKYDFVNKSIAYNVPFYLDNKTTIELKKYEFNKIVFNNQYVELSGVFMIYDVYESEINRQSCKHVKSTAHSHN